MTGPVKSTSCFEHFNNAPVSVKIGYALITIGALAALLALSNEIANVPKIGPLDTSRILPWEGARFMSWEYSEGLGGGAFFSLIVGGKITHDHNKKLNEERAAAAAAEPTPTPPASEPTPPPTPPASEPTPPPTPPASEPTPPTPPASEPTPPPTPPASEPTPPPTPPASEPTPPPTPPAEKPPAADAVPETAIVTTTKEIKEGKPKEVSMSTRVVLVCAGFYFAAAGVESWRNQEISSEQYYSGDEGSSQMETYSYFSLAVGFSALAFMK